MAELNGAIDDPATLLKALDRLRKDFDARTVRGYFQSLAALMRSAIKRGPAIHRTREAQEETELAPLPVQEDEHDGDGVQITGGFAPQLPAFAGPLDEQRVDRPPVSQTMRGRDDPEDYSSPRTAKLRAQRAERASARRELSLSAEQDPLTAHEVAVLTNWLRDNPFEFGHAPLASDLVFGPAHTLPDGAWDAEDGYLGLLLSVSLSDFVPLVETDVNHADDELLFLPAPHICNVPTPGEAFEDILKTLRHHFARPLTRGRISRYKADWLRRAGADAAVVGFLTGQSPRNRAQMHYSCLDQAVLAGWHLRYLDEGLGLPIPNWSMPDGVYGSRLRVPHDFLAGIFHDAGKDVRDKRLTGPGSIAQVQAAHNAFAFDTLMLLYLATGHRPVTHPFEFYADFDLEAGLLWVPVLDTRTMHGETDQQSCGIGHDVSLEALDPLAGIIAPDPATFSGFHTLRG